MAKGRKPLSHEGRVGQERLRMNMSRMDCAFNHWPAIAQSSGATTVRFWIGRTAPHLRLRKNASPACNRSISQASNGRRPSGTAHFLFAFLPRNPPKGGIVIGRLCGCSCARARTRHRLGRCDPTHEKVFPFLAHIKTPETVATFWGCNRREQAFRKPVFRLKLNPKGFRPRPAAGHHAFTSEGAKRYRQTSAASRRRNPE